MSWNDPEKDERGKKKDPWGKNAEAPPDLDETLRQFQQKLRKVFGGGEGGNSGGFSSHKGAQGTSMFGVVVVSLVIFAIYIVSGIFIVDPPEKAVVTRFGQYIKTVGPGPHWIAPLIESRKIVNVEKIHSETHSAHMITKDKNIATAEIAIQYRIDNPEDFLFNLPDPRNTLTLAMRSALRSGVGRVTMDEIMTESRTETSLYIRDQIQSILNNYGAGIKITRANLRKTTVPEGEVQEAYDDANAARQDQEKVINEAMAEKIKQINGAEGEAKAIINEAQAYRESKILEAQGNTQRFLEILPEYRLAPEITKERLYIETMQDVYSNNSKVMIDVDSGNNMIYIPLDKIVDANKAPRKALPDSTTSSTQQLRSSPEASATSNDYYKGAARPSVRPTYSNSSRPVREGASS
ncbi:MAG: FtsH protease activity modulator HflK [Candidatus Berkiella sp.]